MLNTLFRSMSSIGNFSALLLLVVFVFAMIGNAFFRGAMLAEDGGVSRANFDSLGWSMVTVFQARHKHIHTHVRSHTCMNTHTDHRRRELE